MKLFSHISFFSSVPGKGSSSISSDVSSSTDQTPTKAPKNVATSEGKHLVFIMSHDACLTPILPSLYEMLNMLERTHVLVG